MDNVSSECRPSLFMFPYARRLPWLFCILCVVIQVNEGDRDMDRQVTGELKAILHMQQGSVSLEEAWMEGYHQAGLEMAETENPFTANTQEHTYWQEGWWAGFYCEAPLFPDYSFSDAQAVINDAESAVKKDPLYKRVWSKVCQPKSVKTKRFLYGFGVTMGAALVATSMLDIAA